MPSGQRWTHEDYAQFVREHRPEMEVVGKYKAALWPILHRCVSCGCQWTTKPHYVRGGAGGCPDCRTAKHVKKFTYSHERYVARLEKVRSPLRPTETYQGCKVVLRHTCPEGHVVHTKPYRLTHKPGCPQCEAAKHRNNSKAARDWLVHVERHLGIRIRHATQGGEKTIHFPDGTWCKVDGYHPRSKTVFEFHGRLWHGSLLHYAPDATPNPYRPDLTARQLLKATMTREQRLRDLGYAVVSIWEHEWECIKANNLNRITLH